MCGSQRPKPCFKRTTRCRFFRRRRSSIAKAPGSSKGSGPSRPENASAQPPASVAATFPSRAKSFAAHIFISNSRDEIRPLGRLLSGRDDVERLSYEVNVPMNTNIIALTTATLLTLACGSEPNPSGGAGAGGALSGVAGQATAGQPATGGGGTSNATGGSTSGLGGAGASSLGGASGTVGGSGGAAGGTTGAAGAGVAGAGVAGAGVAGAGVAGGGGGAGAGHAG